MQPRTRPLIVRANVDVEQMTEVECLEALERCMTIYRWLVYPTGNISAAPKPMTKKDKDIRNGTRLAIASLLSSLAARLQKEANEE
jgi:hypothetical protein